MTVEIRSPMAGTVIAVDVEGGQAVAADAVLAVVEAMKMHHQLRAERDGRVADIRVKPGDIVAADDVVVLIDNSGTGPSTAPGEQQIDLDEMLAGAYRDGSAFNTASHLEIDDVIDPADTRAVIAATVLSAAPHEGWANPNRHAGIDTW